MSSRKIVHIDEEKCDGCGLCVPSCAEGAIAIRGGKARLVSDVYCDGLGACLGECPQGAITIVEREAASFDEEAVRQHVAAGNIAEPATLACGCPGTAARSFEPAESASRHPSEDTGSKPVASALGHWPVQLQLIPPAAPFLQDADLLLVADCVPVAMADFHQRFLRGRPVAIACPKLDDAEAHIEKLATVIRTSAIRSLTVVHMEVPCCTGLVRIAQAALARSGREVPLDDVVVSVRGDVTQNLLQLRG